MRTKSILFSLLLAFAGFISPLVCAQQDEDVRGAFMTSRPKAAPTGTRPAPTARVSRRHPKQTNPAVEKSGATRKPADPAKLNLARMGLGLTLFMRNSTGLAVRTDPAHEFHKGDHVRFLLETNADGYLYVFNTTNEGPAIMLYPDPDLDEAGNYFQAHVPFEIPSSVAPEERLRWLTFDEHPGAEKIYFVFTREPLAAVPIEDDLITYCRDNEGKCPWHPGAGVWSQIQNGLNEPVKVAKVEGLGNAQTSSEHRAATRGIGLNRDDPEPSLVMLTASTTKGVLVAEVDLIHRSLTMAVRLRANEQNLGGLK